MEIKKKKLGIDFDDVLIEYLKHLFDFHNKTYGTTLTKEDHAVWDLHTTWNVTEEEAIRRNNEFVSSEDHKDISPKGDAVSVLKHLSEKFELIIITARDKSLREPAHHLIEKHFGPIFSSVHFLYEDGVKTNTKGALCKDLDIDFFIDDSTTNIENTLEAGITSFLFDAPWNKEFNDPRAKRVYSWKEIEEILLTTQ